MKMMIELDPDEIQTAVMEYTERKIGGVVSEPTFKFELGSKSVGFGQSEHDEKYFKGCVMEIVKNG